MPPTTEPRVAVTVSSATWPAASGHRKIAVAMSTTSIAHPIAAAVVASAERRALSRIAMPSSAMTAGTQVANRLRCREAEIRSTAGSNTSRKVGSNATSVIEVVSAEIDTGMLISQLLIAVPITASGLRAASGPQPRS